MDPRPILMVADADNGRPMGPYLESALIHEGYAVIHCRPEELGRMRVLAPCPFTKHDVDTLVTLADHYDTFGPHRLVGMHATIARSIADRIESLLPPE